MFHRFVRDISEIFQRVSEIFQMCCRYVCEICQIFFKYVSEIVRSVFKDCHKLFRDLPEMFIVSSNTYALFSELFQICFREITRTVHIFFIYLLIDFPYVFQILIKEFSNIVMFYILSIYL